MDSRLADVVMEGGGVKGIALVGALEVLVEQGYTFRRIAGTSAGAIMGALLAAGMPPGQMTQILQELKLTAFADEGLLDRFGPIGKGLSVVFEKGIYEGDFLNRWLGEQLATLGVRTFGDLKLQESWAHRLPPERQYRLVVLAADVSRGTLVRLPWDYAAYGLDPDKQLVADAVRASASLPFYYEPVKLGGSYLVDGGLISNFPVWIFESGRHRHHRDVPTFGIKLSARPEAALTRLEKNTSNTLSFALSMLSTLISSQDQIHLDDPCTTARTIFVDTDGVRTTDFGLSPERQVLLHQSGRAAAQKFLQRWNLASFVKACSH